MILLRSTVFFLWFSLATTALSLAGFPLLFFDRRFVIAISHIWSRATFWGLKRIAGLGFEIRGPVPPKGVLVASKHMSMWDTIALYLILDDPAVVLKRELLRIPFYGWFAGKAGVIAIDRGGRAHTLRRMTEAAKRELARGRSILIFPEGHRMPPGAPPDYKPGVAALYAQLDVPCIPVALNSGLFWTGPMGFLKKPGCVVVEFLSPIPAGLKAREFLATLQSRIEGATATLLAEGHASPTRSPARLPPGTERSTS